MKYLLGLIFVLTSIYLISCEYQAYNELEPYHAINEQHVKAIQNHKMKNIRQLVAGIYINVSSMENVEDTQEYPKQARNIYEHYKDIYNQLTSSEIRVDTVTINNYIEKLRPYSKQVDAFREDFRANVSKDPIIPLNNSYMLLYVTNYTQEILEEMLEMVGHRNHEVKRPMPMVFQHIDSVMIYYSVNTHGNPNKYAPIYIYTMNGEIHSSNDLMDQKVWPLTFPVSIKYWNKDGEEGFTQVNNVFRRWYLSN